MTNYKYLVLMTLLLTLQNKITQSQECSSSSLANFKYGYGYSYYKGSYGDCIYSYDMENYFKLASKILCTVTSLSSVSVLYSDDACATININSTMTIGKLICNNDDYYLIPEDGNTTLNICDDKSKLVCVNNEAKYNVYNDDTCQSLNETMLTFASRTPVTPPNAEDYYILACCSSSSSFLVHFNFIICLIVFIFSVIV